MPPRPWASPISSWPARRRWSSSPDIPARTRRHCTGCCARWPAASACSPNLSPCLRPDPARADADQRPAWLDARSGHHVMETHYAPFAELLHSIRTGQPAAEQLYGQPFFRWLSHHPEQASRFTGAMANLTSGFKTAAITSCRWMAPTRSWTSAAPTAPCSRPSWRHTRTCAACCRPPARHHRCRRDPGQARRGGPGGLRGR